MNANFFKILSIAFLATFMFTSCDPEPDPIKETIFEKDGVFFVNEGTDNGSLSFSDADDKLHADVFQAENDGAVIGKYVQSASFVGDNIYLVAGGSGKVEVIKRSDISSDFSVTMQKFKGSENV